MRLALLALLAASRASGEAGMFTFHAPPTAKVQAAYGFAPSQAWLDHARLASVRFPGGSGSFVSPDGLVLTNQHVARGAVGKVSTPANDYVKDGFAAETLEKELPLKDTELNILIGMEDVTERVRAAEAGAPNAEAANAARKAEMERIAKAAEAEGVKSEIVALYQGGEYWLYRYKRFTDVRLVMTPENQAAYFGGDEDNFTYPRHALDFSFVRVYENGKPYKPERWLKFSEKAVKDGELVFVTGHPGSTRRLKTVAQLESLRDVELPAMFDGLKRAHGVLEAYSKEGPEQSRQALPLLASYANALKANTGRIKALADPSLFEKKRAEEAALRAAVDAVPALREEYGDAWDRIAEARAAAATTHRERTHRDIGGGPLVSIVRALVLGAQELAKPNESRWPEFQDSALKSLKLRLFSPAPVYPELETRLLASSLERSLEALGAEDPFVKAALGGSSPAEAAARALAGTKLADPEARRALLDGGAAAVEASDDPLVALVRAAAPFYREGREWYERTVEGAETAASALAARARFAVNGTDEPPDATFTLRMSYGRVAGYERGGTLLPAKTTFAGLYDRADSFDGKPPFDLAPKVAAARERVRGSTPLNFAYTGDTIGGNSGSPVLDKDGELVGLNFDGNIEKLAGDFDYRGGPERAIAVTAEAILEALRNVYGVSRLVEELTARAAAAVSPAPVTGITVIDSAPGRSETRRVTDLAAFLAEPKPEWVKTRWIDVDSVSDRPTVEALARRHGLHPLAAEQLGDTSLRPKADIFAQQLFIVTRMVDLKEGRLESEQVSLWVGGDTVLTFQQTPGDVWDPVRKKLLSPEGHPGDAGFLVYSLLDAIVSQVFPVLEHYEDRLEALEARAKDARDGRVSGELQDIKRELLELRHAVLPMREAVNRLQNDRGGALGEEARTYMSSLYNDVVQAMDMLETSRETAKGVTEVHQNALNNRMALVMKTMTGISLVFLPLNFVAGVFGMNFTAFPWDFAWAFPAFAVFCLSLVGGTWWWLRRRRWL